MRKQLIPLLSALTILALALPALADSVYTGDRNFERAWRVYVTRNNPKAEEYFTAAARAYAAALQKDPQERTMRFQSSMVKAGISMYFAGDYDLCIKTLTQAQGKKDKIWDAALFTALAQGRKGDTDATLKAFDKFLDANPSQRYITTEMAKVLPGVKDGSVKLADAIDGIERETQRQFVNNVNRYNHLNGTIPASEACSGAYWWRKNISPCSQDMFRHD